MTLVKQTQTQLQTQLDFFENALVFVERNLDTVSYTHLTLPTIYSV